jgi:ADP-heptose:LPS heptosyltransferase
MKELALVRTGRAGDVLTMLPLLKHLSETGPRPTLIVSAEYQHAAAYCSYFDIDAVPAAFEDTIRVEAKAKQRYKKVLSSAVYGWNLAFDRQAQHFSAEGYYRAGREYGRMYDQGHFRELVFDKPIKAPSLIPHTNPTVVLCFTGNSSPLHDAVGWKQFLAEGLNAAGITVCDISSIRMDSIVDLLPTINAAKAVCTIDTAVAHLMAASKTPYAVFRNDMWNAWYAAPMHKNCAMGVWYSEAPNKRQQVLAKLIELCQ